MLTIWDLQFGRSAASISFYNCMLAILSIGALIAALYVIRRGVKQIHLIIRAK